MSLFSRWDSDTVTKWWRKDSMQGNHLLLMSSKSMSIPQPTWWNKHQASQVAEATVNWPPPPQPWMYLNRVIIKQTSSWHSRRASCGAPSEGNFFLGRYFKWQVRGKGRGIIEQHVNYCGEGRSTPDGISSDSKDSELKVLFNKIVYRLTSDTPLFCKLNVCGILAASKSIGIIFPTIFAHFYLSVTFW